MAKESMKAREVKRAKTVAKYAEKRKALKEAGDYESLQKLPKNASPTACAAYSSPLLSNLHPSEKVMRDRSKSEES